MSEITLKEIINWVEKNMKVYFTFSSKEIVPTSELLKKLHQLEERIEKIIKEKMEEAEKFRSVEHNEFEVIASYLQEILGEKC